MNLLVEKANEIKSKDKKLKKLEEKYVQMKKMEKNLKSDREVFIQFLHLIFPENFASRVISTFPVALISPFIWPLNLTFSP